MRGGSVSRRSPAAAAPSAASAEELRAGTGASPDGGRVSPWGEGDEGAVSMQDTGNGNASINTDNNNNNDTHVINVNTSNISNTSTSTFQYQMTFLTPHPTTLAFEAFNWAAGTQDPMLLVQGEGPPGPPGATGASGGPRPSRASMQHLGAEQEKEKEIRCISPQREEAAGGSVALEERNGENLQEGPPVMGLEGEGRGICKGDAGEHPRALVCPKICT